MSECPIAARLPTGRTLPAGAGNLVLQFRVKGSAAPDESADPRTQRFYALPDTTRAPAVTRHFRFEQGNGQWQINGRLMDSACGDVRLRIRQNSAEHWVFDNNSTTWCTKTTLKPELDSVAVLGRYARRFQTGAGWSFLTGDPRDLELCRRRLGFTNPDPVRDADKLNHTGMVRFGDGFPVFALHRFALGAQHGMHRGIAGQDEVESGIVECRGFLSDAGDAHAGRDVDVALVGFHLALDRGKQRRLAGAVAADDAHAPAGVKGEVYIGQQQALAPAQGEIT